MTNMYGLRVCYIDDIVSPASQDAGKSQLYVPWLDEMGHCEQGAKDNANATDSHIRYAKKRILPSHHSSSRYDQGFGASKYVDRKV